MCGDLLRAARRIELYFFFLDIDASAALTLSLSFRKSLHRWIAMPNN